MQVSIALEEALSEDVRALIAALDAYLRSIEDEGYFMSAEELAQTNAAVFVARVDGKAVACGAMRRHPGGIGELKRMFTLPEYQGKGIAGRIVREIEALARREGLCQLVLETGSHHPWAWRLYEREGFTRCGPVLDYPDVAWSVFYEKKIEPAPVTIAVESPLQDEVRTLIADLNAYLLSLTPPEGCHHLTVEQMAEPDTTVFVARENGKAIACGALKRHAEGIGEVKRMWTNPAYQGRGIGGRVLDEVMTLAKQEGLTKLVLETGDRHPAAWRIYERAGFRRCGPVLDYPDVHWSVFYEKELERTPA